MTTQTPGAEGPTAQDILKMAADNGVQMVDIKFVDMPGTWQHFTIPVSELDEKLFTKGSGFDGSSIRGFQHIHESDMLLVPDPATAVIDPFMKDVTLHMIGDVVDPQDAGPDKPGPYERDPRYIAKKAESYLKSSGIADVSYWGPELEFFIFDSIRYESAQNEASYYIDSDEGNWNSGNPALIGGKPNLGNKIRNKEGYFPVPPVDTLQDIRTEGVLRMQHFGLMIEKHHHEVATAGQGEIDFRFGPLVTTADRVMIYKYVLKNVAYRHGKVATFMPKPLFGDNGTGMHTHQSIWKGGQNLFSDPKGYAGISQTGMHYIGGLLKHASALLAFCAPTTNSYRRLVPGFEAPVNLAMSMRNRSAAARIPMYYPDANAKRVEFRCPDPSANPYLAFAAMLMAGIDGILNKIEPGEPLDKDIYALPPEEAAKIPKASGSLEESLDALEGDHAFLTRGGVFSEEVIATYLYYKRTREVDALRLRPHPYEFHLYFDA